MNLSAQMDIKFHKLYKNLIVMMFELITETQLNWNLETDAAYSVEAWDMYVCTLPILLICICMCIVDFLFGSF